MLLWKCCQENPCEEEAMCRKSFRLMVESLSPEQLEHFNEAQAMVGLCESMQTYSILKKQLTQGSKAEREEALVNTMVNMYNTLNNLAREVEYLKSVVIDMIDRKIQPESRIIN